MQSVALKGFAPDLDTRTPGIMLDCDGIVPTERGFRPLPSLSPAPFGSLGNLCVGAYYAVAPDGSTYLFAATESDIFRTDSTNHLLSVGSYSGTDRSQDRVRFTQFGRYTIAVNGAFPPKYMSVFDQKFKPLPENPIAGSLTETTGLFAFIAAPPNEGDRWQCCALGDPLHWLASPSNFAQSARLLATPGPITALKRAPNNTMAMYKRDSTYVGQFHGPPDGWIIRLISGEAGALCQEGVVQLNDIHFVVGKDQFYLFDGSSVPQKIDTPLRNWFFNVDLDPQYATKLWAWWDASIDTVFVHYVSMETPNPGTIDRYLAWNRISNNWTRGRLAIDATAGADIQQQGI